MLVLIIHCFNYATETNTELEASCRRIIVRVPLSAIYTYVLRCTKCSLYCVQSHAMHSSNVYSRNNLRLNTCEILCTLTMLITGKYRYSNTQ